MPQEALLLIGQNDVEIDAKQRLLVPADVRKSIEPERDGKTLILVLGLNGKQWLYPELKYKALVKEVEPDITPGEAELDFAHANFALAERLEWDTQGRLQFSKEWQEESELGKEVTLIGAGDHLEIWNRADWVARKLELRRRHAEIAIRAKNERKSPGTVPATEKRGSPANA